MSLHSFLCTLCAITNRNAIARCLIPFPRSDGTLDFAKRLSLRKWQVVFFYSTKTSLVYDLKPFPLRTLGHTQGTGQPALLHPLSQHSFSPYPCLRLRVCSINHGVMQIEKSACGSVKRNHPQMWISMETKSKMQQEGKKGEIRPAVSLSSASLFLITAPPPSIAFTVCTFRQECFIYFSFLVEF